MIFSKSLTFDEENLGSAAAAAVPDSACPTAESEFIEKLKQGDAKSFDTLVMRYSSAVYGLLLRITQDPEEAGDLTQETFLRALKAIVKFRGDAELKTWLFRIAINQSRNRFRWWKRRNKGKTVSLDAPIGENDSPMSETIPSGATNPEENTLQLERERLLNKALGELSENFKEAVILCDIEGLSYEEISVTLDINIGTVKSRIARGREELRKKLKDF
ncbi:MAG: sigma-70 family RNA polymerase sigma factor [Pyrinomonadaceae bacterium]|nr:sigma-70 family RNA polymerase sigma factor [Pyrinomonadaceae bacterium]